MRHLGKDTDDDQRVRQNHPIHGERERPPLDCVLQEWPKDAIPQEVHDPEVAGQQAVDVVRRQEA